MAKSEEQFDIGAYIIKKALDKHERLTPLDIFELKRCKIEELRQAAAEHWGCDPENIEFIDPENILKD